MTYEPRAYTVEEVRTEFLTHLAYMVEYWDKVDIGTDQLDRMQGLVHSVLAALDGCAMALPGFLVIPSPHEDDEEFLKAEGENWYPSDEDADIGGSLHEHWYAVLRSLNMA